MDYKLKNFTALVVTFLVVTSGIVLFQNQGSAGSIELSQGGGGGAFLRWEGIEGEATATGHEDEIQILSWSWGATKPGSSYSGLTSRKGDVIISDISIVKALDKSSPKLFEYLAEGRVTPQVQLFLTSAFVSGQQTFLEYEFNNVIITSYIQTGTGGGELTPLESFSFSFEEIKITYTEYDAEGRSRGTSEVVWKVERPA
ncbi:MAG: type VI secretion system tube protein Hcp [Candidatus Heimdallarchaeota archaeon]|nr:type VI secretion system tube protein Hcp [Candidatus Heimdallarchaeota archaeon]